VCGLGDTTYERFANCGKELDRRLGELGATRIVPRKDCDVDYEEPWQAWLDAVIPALRATPGAQAAPPTAAAAAAQARASAPPTAPVVAEAGTRRNPIPARLLRKVPLTAPGSTKETIHVELEIGALKFELGDSLGLWVSNDPESARQVAAAAGLEPLADEPVRVGEERMRFADALVWRLDLQNVDARLVERLHGPLSAEQRQQIVQGAHVVDVLLGKPARWTTQDLVDHLRPLQPRSYSIASSPLVHPGQAHLTVGVVRYELRGSRRAGVASSLLADRLAPGAQLPAFVHVSHGFRLAAPDVPIVMIGPGTGLAPYRAFLQHRKATGAKGPSWLFFGERQRATDYLYGAEIEAMKAEGTLARLDLAFSRDQAERIHVTHRIRERARELYDWIAKGAVIYVCGDAHQMAPDVHGALLDVIASGAGLTREKAVEALHRMEAEGRYRRDVY
jgi:sulfite reductase (NADPH) flavoprotein alpha-component